MCLKSIASIQIHLICIKKAKDTNKYFWISFPLKTTVLLHWLALTHGLQMPNEGIFYRNPKLLGLGRQFGQMSFGAFGVFLANLSAPILVLWVPCPCFLLINHYFYNILSLYMQIPNVYLGLGFEFGPHRISDLAIMRL
jgi:hypothetical protein